MKDTESRTHYELLGVDPQASVDEIKAAYREIARIFHPDSNFYSDIIDDAGPDNSGIFKIITAAYQVLVNEEKRLQYDKTLPQGLNSWDEDSNGPRPGPWTPGEEVETDLEQKQQEDIPEEWKAERAFFQKHFEEILKPAPKVNLVGEEDLPETDAVPDEPYNGWEDAPEGGIVSSFGHLTEKPVLPPLSIIPPSRRAVRPSSIDPVLIIIFGGLPIMALIVIFEVFVLW